MRLPVTLRLQRSSTLIIALVLAHGVAAGGAAAAALPSALRFPVFALLALSMATSLWRHAVRPPIRALVLKADGMLEVEDCDGRCRPAQVCRQSVVFAWLVSLLLRVDGRRVALALPVDALGGEQHRQLRLWLRWKVSAPTA